MNNEDNIEERLIVIFKKNNNTGIYENEFRGIGYIKETGKTILAIFAKNDKKEPALNLSTSANRQQ